MTTATFPGLAYSLAADGSRQPVPVSSVLARARSGEVCIVPGGLDVVGAFTEVREAIVSSIESVAPDVAPSVADRGLGSAHRHLTPLQLHDVFRDAERRLAPSVVRMARGVLRLTDEPPASRYYVCSRIWVRLQAPVPALEADPDVASRPYVVGNLMPAGLHRDRELTHPIGTVSLWGAIGPVRTGNTVRILRESEEAAIAPALDPGDLLVFDADLRHGTVANHLDETRVSCTLRVVAAPLRYGRGPHWRPYIDERLSGTILDRFASLRSRLTVARLRRRRAERARRRNRPTG